MGVATVSRVVNGAPSVRADTRERVLAAVRRLDYAPNAAARALSTGRTGRIGVVAPFFTSASITARLRGVARVLADADRQLVLFAVERAAQRGAAFATLAAGGTVDAVLAVSLAPSPAVAARLEAAGRPVVLLDQEHPTLPCVWTDDVAGGRLAAEHLLALGHERIAFVGDVEPNEYGFTSSARRRAGYEAGLRDAGLAPEPALVRRVPHGRGPAQRAARALLALREPPSAIFAASDEQALGVLGAAAEAGVPVPGRLSVVGFDDVEVARWAGLTTVAQPLEASGAQAADLVLAAIAGAPTRSRRLPLTLVPRVSSAKAGTTPGATAGRSRKMG